MTEKQIEEERKFAARCFLEGFDKDLKDGKITLDRWKELYEKISPFA